jgi:hypothetical protein
MPSEPLISRLRNGVDGWGRHGALIILNIVVVVKIISFLRILS